MAQILLNSPYLVKHVESGLESISVVLWVVQGAKSTAASGVIAYELETKAYNAYAMVDIAQLAKDYLDVQYQAPYWVSYRITKVVNGVETVITPAVTLAGLNGYGYFREDYNPQITSPIANTLMQSNTDIYVPKGRGVSLSLLTETAQDLDLYYKGIYKGSITNTAATNSNEIITVHHLDSLNHVWKSNERALWSSTLIRNKELSNNVDENLTDFDAGQLNTKVYVKEVECHRNDPIKIHFLNKFGAIQPLWFFGRETVTTEARREKFNRNLKNINYYDINQHQTKILTVNGREKKVINTGFYPESFNEVFKQLLFSSHVWIYNDEKDVNIPVNIVSSELRHKTSQDDKLINYQIEFEHAFDEINNIK